MNCSWVELIATGFGVYLIILFTGLMDRLQKIFPKVNDQQIHILMISISVFFAIFVGTNLTCSIGEDYPGEDSYQGRVR